MNMAVVQRDAFQFCGENPLPLFRRTCPKEQSWHFGDLGGYESRKSSILGAFSLNAEGQNCLVRFA
jgi:hypothetical protein